MAEQRGEETQGSLAYVLVLTLVAALGGLLFGYDTGVISGAIGFLSTRFDLNADMQGWATSSALVGCIVGACFAGVLSDSLERRRAFLPAETCPPDAGHLRPARMTIDSR